MSREQFEDVVADALDEIPQELLDRLDNVVFLIEDEPTDEQRPPHGDLLGLYVGIPLPERLDSYHYGSMPDRIYLFQGPLTRHSRDRDNLVEQIRVTTLHEIGHYFGIDDDRLHELGWG
ncbi:metallopeptidase family protein [Yimella sp. cx-51]|nr:metallopeptidase family protein [Yimella sp. cx-51]MBC9957593.1 metallopeptidase family protein [Yimella sp. cx-51]MBD2758635.1 metallopeptidase family protein [Yimella sp. cx-573]QTH39600.1 metallopeptidase family protein [Yimella sp. cx-51]